MRPSPVSPPQRSSVLSSLWFHLKKNESSATVHPTTPPPPAPASFEILGDDGRSHHLMWQEHAQLDAANRRLLIEQIAKDAGLVDETERKIVEVAKALLAKHDRGQMRATYVRMSSPLLKGKIFKTQQKDQHGSSSTLMVGSVRGVVRGASIEDLIAYNMDLKSRFFCKHEWDEGVADDKIIERLNPHHIVYYYKTTPSPPFSARDFVHRVVWVKESSEQYILVLHPTEHKDATPTPDVVRATTTRVFRFTSATEQ